MTMSESATEIDKGMAGIVAAETQLSDVRGDIGELIYCGYNIDELAENATFEEVVHLLHRGHLPNGEELASLKAELSAARTIPAGLADACQFKLKSKKQVKNEIFLVYRALVKSK